VSIAGTYREEFDGNSLNTTLWEAMVEGDASYKIADSEITMDSPGVPDGLLIYWRGGDITNEDFSFEISAVVSADTNNAALIAFIRVDLPPTLNTTINAEWKNMFWCGTNTPGWYINNDDWQRTPAEGPEFEGVWRAEIVGDKIRHYFNDEEVGVIDKIPEERFVCFGPDTYTSHYSGSMTVDYIELSGPTVKDAAVDASGKVTIYTACQGTFMMRSELARILGLPLTKVRVVPTEVGGAFGGKIYPLIEPICAHLALKARLSTFQ